MRVWYQSLVEGNNPSYFEGLAARARMVGRPGTEVDFVGLPPGTYGGRAPAEVVVYPYLMSLHIQSILDNGLRAEAQGYDVFVVGSVQDPGMEEARSLLDIPVVEVMAERRCTSPAVSEAASASSLSSPASIS